MLAVKPIMKDRRRGEKGGFVVLLSAVEAWMWSQRSGKLPMFMTSSVMRRNRLYFISGE